ncbi:MAG TPA: electron transfer flavoprotein subunit alpha, partial [Candidatus Limnocylindria bacterium]|nr:electron transfer flavoprotein subunit alpha [Candidatus Limnocylindria bacterium]
MEALATALALGGELTVGLMGSLVQPAADQIAGCGAVRFVGVCGDSFAQSRYATDAAAAEAICRAADAAVVIAPATSRWSRTLSGVAHRLGGRVDTHATNLTLRDGVPAVTRWFYRQRMEAVLTRFQRPWIVLLDGGCTEPWSGAAG